MTASMACQGSPQQRLLRLLITIACLLAHLQASSSSDADTLIEFKGTLTDGNGALGNWIAGTSPCVGNKANWTGIICDGGSVLGLQLENISLSGTLKLEGLGGLLNLRTVSFKNNSLEGQMPDVGKLGGLRSIYLSMNKLSGQIPDDAFQGMGSLRRVHLSINHFSGSIPSSLASLQRLVELRLDANDFSGAIPDLRQQGLELVNVSDNNLHGPIPDSLSRMSPTLFAGNKDLCGLPLGVACNKSKKLSTVLVVSITVIVIAVVLVLAGVIIALIRRRRDKKEQVSRAPSLPKPKQPAAGRAPRVAKRQNDQGGDYGNKAAAAAKEQEQGSLVLLKEGREKFELQDLLKASAEILGSGSLGSSYKAVLMDGPAVVVKRFKEMNRVGKDEFQEHMRRLGKLAHPNLLPLVAYYYRKEEKLLVTDYILNGSLANLLHGNGDSRKSLLDWPTRLKIVKGVARGLAYLNQALPMLTVPHGHLKSSNVLLNASFEPLLTEYAFAPLINQTQASQVMVANKSPECIQYGKTSKKSDVWSFGILILELLTGRSPGNYGRQGRSGDTDLVSWVNSVVREEWTGEVFDSQMKGTRNSEGDMLKLLQIGLGCCERNTEKRWDVKEALHKIEELREKEVSSNDEDYSSFYSDAGDAYYSSRAMTDDEFSFSAKT